MQLAEFLNRPFCTVEDLAAEEIANSALKMAQMLMLHVPCRKRRR